MKIGCQCGETIFDITDYVPNKAHLIPDQDWFPTYDAIDDEIIDPIADGRLGKEAAYMLARQIISRSARLMWQCATCGRLYIDDIRGNLQCYVPEREQTDREILRGNTKRA